MAIVNQAFVKQYFPDEDPIGRRIELGAPATLITQDLWMGTQRETVTIAGVMRDNRDQGLGLPVAPQLIALFRQTPVVNFGFKDVLVRSNVAPDALEQAVIQQVRALDPQLPLSEVETMSEYLDDVTAAKRFTSVILVGFAGMGLVLAVMGIYGVIAYLVAQRTQEIGIPAGVGRAAERGAVAGVLAGIADGAGRGCNWTDGDGAGGTEPGESTLWGFGARSGDAGNGFGGADRDCAGGVCAAGAKGSED